MRKPVDGLIWLIILLSFSIVLGVLLIGGTITLYLAPRMVPVVWFGFCIFGILSIYQVVIIVRDMRAHKGGPMKLYSLVFLLPIFLLTTATPQASTPQMLPNQNIGFGAIDTPDTAQRPSPSPKPAATPPEDISPFPDLESSPVPAETSAPEEPPMPEMDVADMPFCILNPDPITGQGYGSFADYMYLSMDELIGQEITVYGFVYQEDSFPLDTILVSRLMITCCAADAMVVGFHVRVEDANDFSSDEWIQVTGTVQRFAMEMYGETYELPILTGGTVTRCEAPPTEDAYIYP